MESNKTYLSTKITYIYGLYDDSDTNKVIRYIGKTDSPKKRIITHKSASKQKSKKEYKKNRYVINWINSVVKNGNEIKMISLKVVPHSEWEQHEINIINEFKHKENVKLTNISKGGKGGGIKVFTLSYEEAKKIISEQIPYIKTVNEWRVLANSNNDIFNILPKHPKNVFENDWISWSDFLNTKNISPKNKKKNFLSYEDSKNWLKENIIIKSKNDWETKIKQDNFPFFIPKFPQITYKNNGWISFFEFLGIKKRVILNYNEAKKWLKENKSLKSYNEYIRFSKEKTFPDFLPKAAMGYYKERGWLSCGDFLSTNNKFDNNVNYISYDEAKNWISKNLSLVKNQREWKIMSKTDKMPIFIPRYPKRYYSNLNRNWISWSDFLSNETIIATYKKKFLSFEEAKNYIKEFNIQTVQEWIKLKKNKTISDSIPMHPERTYKEYWKNWAYFFGKEKA